MTVGKSTVLRVASAPLVPVHPPAKNVPVGADVRGVVLCRTAIPQAFAPLRGNRVPALH